MPAKLRVYLDASVLSAKHDARDPGRQRLTEPFWSRLGLLDPVISETVLQEIGDTPDAARRSQMMALTGGMEVLPPHPGREPLVGAYIADGVFTPAMTNDARHVAAAVLANVPVLASWNFRHLVNRSRRIRVNLINAAQGCGQIEIVSPPEIE